MKLLKMSVISSVLLENRESFFFLSTIESVAVHTAPVKK